MFANNNRNKLSLAIDLKSDAGKEILTRLIKRCDVFMHNMRVEAIGRLGFGVEDVRRINPAAIYSASVGFGQDGRYRARPAYDDVVQAASGLAALSREMGKEPAYIPSVVADKVAALYAAYGILAAIASRARGNTDPIEVETPMFESLVSFVLNEHLAAATFMQTPDTMGYHRVFSHNRRPYETKNGWVAALPYTKAQWTRFLKDVGREDVLEADWFADEVGRSRNIDKLYEILSAAMKERTTAEWLQALERLDIPFSKVNGFADLLNDPHLGDVDFFKVEDGDDTESCRALRQPVVYRGVERRPDARAPDLGQHSRDVLELIGYAEDDIENMVARKVVGVP